MKIVIDLAAQTLCLLDEQQQVAKLYQVSTAAAGIGEQQGSMQTPRGLHVIRAKIGAGLPVGAVLRGRRPTGETHTPELGAQHPQRDWILSRILWLSGCQPGFNRLGQVDTLRRYIYIHGTPDDQPMGVPASHGCVRMRNADVVELFGLVNAGTEVLLVEGGQDALLATVSLLPQSTMPGLWATLTALSLPLPASPALAPQLLPAYALWRADGKLLAIARLQSGGSVGIAGAAGEADLELTGLLQALAQSASALGWHELRMAITAQDVAKVHSAGFEVQRVLPDTTEAVLCRKWLTVQREDCVG